MPLTSHQEQLWQETNQRLQEYLAAIEAVKQSVNVEAFRKAWDTEKRALNAYFEARERYLASCLGTQTLSRRLSPRSPAGHPLKQSPLPPLVALQRVPAVQFTLYSGSTIGGSPWPRNLTRNSAPRSDHALTLGLVQRACPTTPLSNARHSMSAAVRTSRSMPVCRSPLHLGLPVVRLIPAVPTKLPVPSTSPDSTDTWTG